MAKKPKVEEVVEDSQELDAFIEQHCNVIDADVHTELDTLNDVLKHEWPCYEVKTAFKADIYGVKYDCQPGDVVAFDDIIYRKLKEYLK